MRTYLTPIVNAVVALALLVGCMTEQEYYLRKKQLENQAAHPATFEPMSFEMTGPVKLELVEGSQLKVRITAPGQPFREISIPNGIKTQADLVRHLVDVGAISVIGWKAIDGAKGRTTTINNNAAGAQP